VSPSIQPLGGEPAETAASASAAAVETGAPIYLPPFRVDVTSRAGVVAPVGRRRIAAAIVAALRAAGAPTPASIGVVLSGDLELAELNEAHMGHEGPTDVLSFPFLPPEAFGRGEPGGRRSAAPLAPAEAFALPPGSRVHLGDMIVSVERAAAQASEGRGGQTSDVRWTAAQELLLLVVHGSLHICGFDHAEPAEEAEMRALERRVLGELGAQGPLPGPRPR
jgi:probable rRNA maturation factor